MLINASAETNTHTKEEELFEAVLPNLSVTKLFKEIQ
jgi:hypothetical protein